MPGKPGLAIAHFFGNLHEWSLYDQSQSERKENAINLMRKLVSNDKNKVPVDVTLCPPFG